MSNRTLSIPEWHKMAMEGAAPSVRIQLNGVSMFPLIRFKRDCVTVISPDRELKVGDIVMIAQQEAERYVMHRIWKIRDGQVMTWGDNCPKPDGWFPIKDIWGRVILIERGKRIIHPNPRKGMVWARIWHLAGKGYRAIQRYREKRFQRIREQRK